MNPRLKTSVAAALASCLLAGTLLVSGCATPPRPANEIPAPPPPPSPPPEFVIVAGMLDTWNAMGEILVNTQDVHYRGRSQMLGLYDLDYRDERILLITKAFVLDSQTRTPTTLVRATQPDGKPDRSPAAMQLLQVLQDRLPGELERIAKLPPAKPRPAKKPKRH